MHYNANNKLFFFSSHEKFYIRRSLLLFYGDKWKYWEIFRILKQTHNKICVHFPFMSNEQIMRERRTKLSILFYLFIILSHSGLQHSYEENPWIARMPNKYGKKSRRKPSEMMPEGFIYYPLYISFHHLSVVWHKSEQWGMSDRPTITLTTSIWLLLFRINHSN